jgi:hypothetical protein
MDSPWLELVVALALMYLGGSGLSQGMTALRHRYWPISMSAPYIGMGITLIFLGNWMGCQALAVLRP